MKYCSKCGRQLDDADVFCAACGASQKRESNTTNQNNTESKEQDSVQKNNKNIKKIIIPVVAGVVAVGAAVAILFATGVFASPAKRFKQVHEEVYSKVFDNDEFFTDLKKGEIEITAETGKKYQEKIGGANLLVKYDIDEDSTSIVEAEYSKNGKAISGVGTIDSKSAGFYVPEAINEYYKLDYSELFSDVDYSNAQKTDFETQKEILHTFFEAILETVNEDNVEKTSVESDFMVLGKPADYTKYTFKPSTSDVEECLDRIITIINQDEKVRLFIGESFADNLVSQIEKYKDDLVSDFAKMEISLGLDGRDLVYYEIKYTNNTYFVYEHYVDGADVSEVFVAKDGNFDEKFYNNYTKDGSNVIGKITGSTSDFVVNYSISLDSKSLSGIPYFEINAAANNSDNEMVKISLSDIGEGDKLLFSYSDSRENHDIKLDATIRKGEDLQEPSILPTYLTQDNISQKMRDFENKFERLYDKTFD